MSSIGTNSEDLVLNADGSSSEIKLKIDGTEKASISSAGAFTSTTIDATKLTGALPAISGANLTGIAATVAALTDATVSSSDPAIDTNPSATGHLWVNKTSGECFVSTDVTTDNNVWTNIGGGSGDVQPAFAATGGTTSTYTYNSVDYKIHTFTSSSSFVVTGLDGTVDALVLAAGGGGGAAGGGGGGAGELVWNTGITAAVGSITVTVGAGSVAADGSDSWISPKGSFSS